jgi:large subunit ribosomal protein L29
MKKDDLKGKSADELKKMLLDTRKEQFNLRFQHSGGQLENTAQMRKIRRNIARIKTMMNQQADKAA